MTLIKFSLTKPGPLVSLPARGSLLIGPNKRRDLDHSIEVPDPFRLRLGEPWIVDGITIHPAVPGVAWADLAPTTVDWAWRIWEKVNGGSIHYKRVPAASPPGETYVEYDDLEEVDPRTLAVTAVPEAAWWLHADNLQAQIDALGSGIGDPEIAAFIADPAADSHTAVVEVVADETETPVTLTLLFENALV